MQLETPLVEGRRGEPGDLLTVLRTSEAALAAAPRPSPMTGTVAQWSEVAALAQRVVNMATAVQDDAVVALAAIEPEVLEDGTVVEAHRAPGHIALDAPAIISGALSISANAAEHRVHAAVRLAADGPAGSATATGLGALHEAMAGGRLDSYRAGVLADELDQAPPEIAAAVVHALEGCFDSETGPRLRARCRRVLASISPDLLRQRATRAREQCGLRRWAQEPGVDQWEGTFPSEDAARAWAAIDARAQQLRADGTFSRIERARAQALIDLVTGSATVTTVLTLTVPAAVADEEAPDYDDTTDGERQHACPVLEPTAERPAPSGTPVHSEVAPDAEAKAHGGGQPAVASPDDLVEVSVSGIAQPVLVTRRFLRLVSRAVESQTVPTACHPGTGALLGGRGSSAYRPPVTMVALVKQRDGRCRFPGCHVNARFCDLDHVRPWPTGPTDPANLICLCRHHHRIKQRHGWQVRLTPDGQCTWTDPTGRVSTTSALDALHALVLPSPAQTADTDLPGARPLSTDRGSRTRYHWGWSDRHSDLEFVLEHHAAAITDADLTRIAALGAVRHPATGERTRIAVDLHRAHQHRRTTGQLAWPGSNHTPARRPHPQGPRSRLNRDHDPPPF